MLSFKNKYFYSLLSFLAVLMLVSLYKNYRLKFPQTDDAYLKAHIVEISPRLTAPLSIINVRENQFVEKGAILVELDQSVYNTQLNAAQAAFETSLEISKANEAAVDAALSIVEEKTAALIRTDKDLERIKSLYLDGLISEARYFDAKILKQEMQASKNSADFELLRAKMNLGERGELNSQVRLAKANLDEARLKLSFTKIVAPADGWVSNFDLRAGMIVEADEPIFSIIEDTKWWIEANFKETQMKNIRPGQPVKISVDMFPNLGLIGEVESLGAGSGVTFSLLPPQNATGNWVKITQRFPVKVLIINAPKTEANGWSRLKVGSSVVVTVDAREL